MHHFLLLLSYLTYGHSLQSSCYNCTCREKPPAQLIVNCSFLGLTQVPGYLPRNLTTLDLSNNALDNIPESYFETFTKLSNLNISDNTNLGLKNASVSFFGLKNSPIKVLNASGIVKSNTGCVTMKKDFFTYLNHSSLQEIYLDRNRILTIEEDALNSVPNTLEVLSLRKSRIVVDPSNLKQFLNLKNVKTLDVSHLNREAHLIDILNTPNILRVREDSKYPSRHVEKRTTSSHIIHIPLPPKLEKFYAKDSNLKTVVPERTEIIFGRNNLKVLNLSKNRIGKITGAIRGLETLEELDISDNVCDQISPKLLNDMPNLKTLILRGNKLDFKTSTLVDKPLQYLETLDMSLNRFYTIPSHAFTSFPALKNLILRGNIIPSFYVRITHMSNLSRLDLSNNQINYLAHYITDQLDVMSKRVPHFTLNLTGNPLKCSCSTVSFIRWIITTHVHLDKENLYCHVNHHRKKLVSIVRHYEKLKHRCTHTSHVGIAFGGLAAVTAAVVITLMGIAYRFRWKLRYLYYIVRGKYRGNLVAQNNDDADFEYDAFISYAEEDSEFAVNHFTDMLESAGQLRLCIHQRDFRPGEPIASNILSAIQRCRHVVIVLSPNFLDSYWCRWEFEMARMESLYTERNMVVLVKYQEVLSRDVPRDMLYMMHTQTYLEYPEAEQDQDTFWTALRQAIEAN